MTKHIEKAASRAVSGNKASVIFDWIINILAYSSGVLVMFMMFLISADVVLRKLTGLYIEWSVEFTENAVSYVTFASAAWLLKHNRHVNIDLVVTNLNKRNQTILNAVTSIIGSATCLFMAYRSFVAMVDVAQRNISTVTVLEVPMAPLIGIIAGGMLLLAIQFARIANGHLQFLKGRKTSSVVKPGSEDVLNLE